MTKIKQTPVNIWNDIERCWVNRLDIVYEGKTIVGIHHSDFEDVINDIDILCKKLQQYKSEMECIYKNTSPSKNSIMLTYIYLIVDENSGLTKIGRSIDPKFREKTLRSEEPNCKIIWISDLVEKKQEKVIHNYFKEKRIRGEWFSLTDFDVKFIKENYYGLT